MTDEEKKTEESGNRNAESVTSDGVTSDEPKSESKHGLFHHHCKKCEKLSRECKEYKAGWQRATADYQNLQKETEAMRGEWARYSEQQILEEFIPVYDNFRKAFKDTDEADFYADHADHADVMKKIMNWKKGIEMIMKQFEEVLKNHGVEEIKTVGEIFNPEFHEAVGEEIVGAGRDLSVPDLSIQEGIIVREVEAGYTMRGKVVKVAKVIVAKKSE